ncbi:hypothetical protein BKP45_21050 [Anaerobacillus alkalidiazotrophicus]|uniref:Type I restriction modification DNA specificity domain-containing protein n=1 Tax=Anaerobacillus alkalidiazotrophicus TaxID=472963 RepID=A0A1S2LXT5_9BACI|nr:restriction endonuclease subunit S [Anaerobacillus alkalidiazotrophicus]OIJ16497.1 hypothetical protein BKP45_21050 [Anaerobacillus alkalidiazotrophicus]
MKYNNDWKKYKLSDVTTKIGSGATPKGGQESYIDEGVTFIRSQNVYNHKFSYNGLAFINDEQAKKLNNVTIEEDDILLNITGDSVCRCCIVPKQVLPARVNQHVAIIRCDKNKILPVFLKSFLTTNYMQTYMLSIAQHGGTRAALTKGMIQNLEISIPSLQDQERIVSILNAIEYKIEIDIEMKKTLEEIAQTLFKHWFVDFEFPNKEGQSYKSSGGKFVQSVLGMVPEGWELSKLEEVISIKHGFAFKSKDFSVDETDFYILTPGNFKIGGGFKEDKFKYLNEGVIFPSQYILNEDDLLVTMTDLSRDGDTLGYPAFIPTSDSVKYLHNQRLGKVILKSSISKQFLYYLFCTPRYRGHILGSATGTTVKHTAPKRIEEFTFINPNKSTLEEFDKIVTPLFKLMKSINAENSNLIELRNTLLPKLMSGEIRIPDAEKEVEKCLQKSN